MTQPDTLHTRLEAEINRRLAMARAAEGADWTLDESADGGPKVGEWSREVNYQVWHCDDDLDGCPEVARGWITEARHIALHDPADAIRRYEGELEVLERHLRELKPGFWCDECSQQWPCAELKSLAHRLGVSVDG